MMLLLIIQLTRVARFAKEVWQETQRLRRTFPGPAGE